MDVLQWELYFMVHCLYVGSEKQGKEDMIQLAKEDAIIENCILRYGFS